MIASSNYETLFDYAGKKNKTVEINELMGASGFWDNQEKAQELVNNLQQLQIIVKPLTELVSGAEDLEVLMEFIEEDGSEDSIPELAATAERLETTLAHLELQSMMSAPEDGSAAYLSIQAGEGGTDSSD